MPKIKPAKILMIAAFILAAAAAAWYFFKPEAQPAEYISAEVSRGDTENSVLATRLCRICLNRFGYTT